MTWNVLAACVCAAEQALDVGQRSALFGTRNANNYWHRIVGRMTESNCNNPWAYFFIGGRFLRFFLLSISSTFFLSLLNFPSSLRLSFFLLFCSFSMLFFNWRSLLASSLNSRTACARPSRFKVGLCTWSIGQVVVLDSCLDVVGRSSHLLSRSMRGGVEVKLLTCHFPSRTNVKVFSIVFLTFKM